MFELFHHKKVPLELRDMLIIKHEGFHSITFSSFLFDARMDNSARSFSYFLMQFILLFKEFNMLNSWYACLLIVVTIIGIAGGHFRMLVMVEMYLVFN